MEDTDWMKFVSDIGDFISEMNYVAYGSNFGEVPAATIKEMATFKGIAEWVKRIENHD